MSLPDNSSFQDIFNACLAIAKTSDGNKAVKFIKEYADLITEETGLSEEEAVRKAAENIGYLSGYYSEEDADAIMDVFDIPHHIFGWEHPTPEEAFKKGSGDGRVLG